MFGIKYPVEQINLKTTGKILAFISRGRDAAVMTHLLTKSVDPSRLVFVHLWHYPDLEYQKKQIALWERFFGIKIHLEMAEEVVAMVDGKKSISFGEMRDIVKNKYGAKWSAYGYRMDENMGRRALLKPHADGIHYAQETLYPLRQFNQKTVNAYAIKNRIPLAVEYKYGLRDISIFDGAAARWLRDTYPDDFERACG